MSVSGRFPATHMRRMRRRFFPPPDAGDGLDSRRFHLSSLRIGRRGRVRRWRRCQVSSASRWIAFWRRRNGRFPRHPALALFPVIEPALKSL